MTYEANEEKNQKQPKKPPSEHKKNARPSTSDKHQKGQARKQEIKSGQKNAERRITKKDVDDGYKVW